MPSWCFDPLIYVTVEQHNQIVLESLKSLYKIKQRRKLRSINKLNENLRDDRFSEKLFDMGNEFHVKSKGNVDPCDTVDNSSDIANKPSYAVDSPSLFRELG